MTAAAHAETTIGGGHWALLGVIQAALEVGKGDPQAGLEIIAQYEARGWEQTAAYEQAREVPTALRERLVANAFQAAVVEQRWGSETDRTRYLLALQQDADEWRERFDAHQLQVAAASRSAADLAPVLDAIDVLFAAASDAAASPEERNDFANLHEGATVAIVAATEPRRSA